jgi:GNAT superfamily N-acetyltransferase
MPFAMSRITLFEVPRRDDEAFVAARERARDDDGGAATALHRALREDVDFRFVDVAGGDSASVPGRDIPFASHSALYEVAHEDGAPDGTQGVVLIEAFEVARGADEPFRAAWREAHAALAAQPGYQGARLHRAVAGADFRFVEVARWSSPLGFSKALQRAAPHPLAVPSHPALYLVVGR